MRKLIFVLALSCLAAPAVADPRPWTFTYDLYSEGKGNWEYEQWVTWKTDKKAEKGYDRVEFRHEFEVGLADNFDLAIYLPNWHVENSDKFTGSRFDSIGLEAIVYLLNPVTDPVGVGLYAEVSVGDKEIEFEQKLLIQKDVGRWAFAYNLILETELEREGSEIEVEGKLAHALAASYSLGKNWQLGAEMTVASEYERWSKYEGTTVYGGPAVGFQAGRFWATLTAMRQLSNHDDQPDFQLRLIAAVLFH
jgi:hypothetical protein